MLPTTKLNLPVIPASAYAATLKEYEDLDETDSEGDDLSWSFDSFVVYKIVSIFWMVYSTTRHSISLFYITTIKPYFRI